MTLLARAMAQKGAPHDYTPCAGCGRPRCEHHAHGACPLEDGSGYSISQHFHQVRPAFDMTALDEALKQIEEAPNGR
jgi:hypothetical protein